MESSGSGKGKGRKLGESSQSKGKKQKVDTEHEGTEQRLNQDLIDQLPGSRPKTRRSTQIRVEVDKLDDKCKFIGDAWTAVRGYELFNFHYHRQNRFEPVCNPWKLNLGKLVCPNVFVNAELVKLLADHYDPKHKEICDPSRKPQIHVSKEGIGEVFKLEGFCDEEINCEE